MAQLLSNLPIGAKVKFGKYSVNGETAEDIGWLIVAKSHNSTPAYPTNSITLMSEKIIDLLCVDGKEYGSPISNRANYGNNRYSLSSLDQWLNKDGTSWFSGQHSTDSSPSLANSSYGTSYANRPAFLNAFTSDEKNAILPTTIRVVIPSVDGGGYEDISRKVFLASTTELGLANESNRAEGNVFEYFSSNSRVAYLTNQAYTNSPSTSKPARITDAWDWWLRTPQANGSDGIAYVYPDGTRKYTVAYYGKVGVRPALNLSSTMSVSDSTDSNGYYSVVWNSSPNRPSTLNVPTIYGGKANSISWNKANDPDGDAVTYQLECSINGGAYSQIYNGTTLVYAHIVPFGTNTVSYRVKATDPSGASSEYTTSTTITVVNNNAPVISGADSNLGVKSDGFTGTYTVTDADNNIVTVSEAIDGIQIRSLVATLGQAITYGVTETTWLSLPNGSHTLTISATDGIDTSVRTYTFTKLVDSLKIQNSTPWIASTMPSRIILVVTRNVPSTSIFKVEVCNNGYDDNPTWEDATNAVTNGLVHVFSNTTKTAADWGILVRVTVERNGATGACYISAIGGNFE